MMAGEFDRLSSDQRHQPNPSCKRMIEAVATELDEILIDLQEVATSCSRSHKVIDAKRRVKKLQYLLKANTIGKLQRKANDARSKLLIALGFHQTSLICSFTAQLSSVRVQQDSLVVPCTIPF